MNATPLPTALISPAPASQGGARARNGNAEAGSQFSAHLDREVGQRQAAPAATPAPAPAKAAASAARQQNGQAEKPATAGQSAAPASDAPATTEGQVASGKPIVGERVERFEDVPVFPVDPMVELIGLVASFNQPGVPPTDSPATAESGALAPGGAPAPSALAAGGTSADVRLLQAAEAALGAVADGPGQDETMPVATDGKQTATGASRPDLVGAERPARFQFEVTPGAPRAERAPGAQETARAGVLPDLARTESTVLAARTANPGTDLPLAPDNAPAAPLAGPLAQGALGAAMQAAAGLAAGDKIPARVGTPAWDNQVAQKVVWMVAGEEQSATLTLNPPDMGPMQVVLSVTNDHATVTFSSATPEVRQALEDAMPTLRDMMRENGIALGDANVNDGAAEQRQAQAEALNQRQRNGNGGGNGNGRPDGDTLPEPSRPVRRGGAEGLVDTFA